MRNPDADYFMFLELPQLRTMTSMELGCDSRGYSRAGTNTKIWYCAIVVGRASPELNEMREVSFQLCNQYVVL